MSPSSYPRVGDFSWKMGLHPSKLTWNLKSPLWKGKSCSIIFQTSIFWTWTLEIVLAEDRCIMMHWWHDDVMKYSNQYSKKSQKSKYIYIIFIYLFTYIHVYIYISKYNLYFICIYKTTFLWFHGASPYPQWRVTLCISVERKNGEFQGVAIGFLVELLW